MGVRQPQVKLFGKSNYGINVCIETYDEMEKIILNEFDFRSATLFY